MNKYLQPDINILLFGIAYECPFRDRKAGCPLMEIDHLLFIEKVSWIINLKEERKKVIVNHHVQCVRSL